jgi:hypothetical protein
MEAEHARIDPLLDAVDTALADPARAEELGDLVDALVTGLSGHLAHEEEAALPLIDSVATPPLLQGFGQAHTARIGDDTPRYLPWLLEGASGTNREKILAILPPPVRALHDDVWTPAHHRLERWPTGAA